MSVCICGSFVVKTAGLILVTFVIALYTISYSTNVVMIYVNEIKTVYGDSKHLQDKSYTTSYSFVVHLTAVSSSYKHILSSLFVVCFLGVTTHCCCLFTAP
jgi:hypothetical protein